MPRPRPYLEPLPLGPMRRAGDQHGLLTTSQLLASGLDRNAIQRYAAAGTLHSVHRGVWSLVRAMDLTVAARVAAARIAVGDGVACFQTGGHLHGADVGPVDPRTHVSFQPSKKKRQLAGVARHWLDLSSDEVVELQGVPCVSASRLVLDAGRNWLRDDVVSLVDALLRNHAVGSDELSDLAPRLPRAARSWLALVDASAESPLETRTRLLLHDADLLREFVPQWEVRGRSGVVARIDFAAPGIRLGVECDGRGPHELPEALFRDRRRADDLAALGWRLLRVTWADVTRAPTDVVRRVRRALVGSS